MNNSKEQNIASGNPSEMVLDVYDSNNNLYTTLPNGTNGFKSGDTVYRYKDDSGKDVFTKDILDLPMYASLDEKTGDIIITAPGSIYNTDEFQKTFDKSILESYSLAYKLNPNYKVSVMEKNEETGVEEEKQVTIPEWIEKLNESFKVYKDNLRLVRDTKKNLVSQYGEKANNLSTAQINRILQNPTSGVYIPDILFSVNFFGDNPDLGNPFESIRGKSGADGSFTLDDLKSVFTRENFGRSELAGVLATIDGALKSSNWDKEDTYTDADGNTVKNRNSADEASKLIAFKDFLLKNHPESEWYQQVGDNIETLCLNFDYYTTRVFANIANVIEAGATEGNGHAVQNWIKEDLDPTMEQYNMYSQMETDAAQAMQVIGMIGGTLLGSAGAGVIAKGLGALVLSPFAVGASLAVKAMPALQKLATLTTIAKTFSTAHPMLAASASFLLDTLHDAILFDSTTLRDTLEAADGDTRAYWEGQLADNMKWWTGMAGARTLVKFAGKTPIGKALDAWFTPYINKKLAVWGERKADFYDRMAGGSLIRKIEDQIKDAKYGSNKFNRLVKKHIQLEWNEILRTARKELGDIKIETKLGIFPTKEGYKDLLDAKNNIKSIENAIDSYARNINYKVGEYISPQYDPATKQMRYINPDLAKANQNASDFYYKLVSLTKKYGLSVSDQGFLNQDMIDYWVGSAHLETMIQMSKYGNADHAKLALENIPILEKNIAAAKSALPQEITSLIDQGIQNRVYQNWYKAQNEFAKHKGLVNADQIDSYDNNPIWKEIGYMPANIKTDPTGRFIRNDGTVEAVISQDIEHFTYRVSEGQHYADPELVRFNKLRALAKADVNRDIIKAYNSLSSAKNVVKLSGEDTEYARKINENRKSLEKLLNVSASEQFKPGEIEFKLLKSADGKQTVNVEIDLGTRSIVISSLSPDEVSQFLANKKVIKGKNGKISDNVNAENYNEWFNNQSSEVKKYLKQKYTEMTGDDVDVKTKEHQYDGLEFFDAVPGTYEHKQMVGLINGQKDIDYYAQNKDQRVAFVYMSPDEYLEALTKKNGGPYENIDEILGRSRERWTTKDGKKTGWMDYADQMRLHDFDPNAGDGKFPPPRLIYDKNGYSGQEGIHRALAARSLGVKEMPVSVEYSDRNMGENVKRIIDGKTNVVSDNLEVKRFENPANIEGDDGNVGIRFEPNTDSQQPVTTNIPVTQVVHLPEEIDVTRVYEPNSYELFKRAVDEGGVEFEAGLQRAYLLGDEGFSKSPLMNEAARNLESGKEAFYDGVVLTRIKGELRNLTEGFDVDTFSDDLIKSIRAHLEDYVNKITGNGGARAVIDSLASDANGADLFARYFSLKSLHEKANLDRAKKSMADAVWDELKDRDVTIKNGEKIRDLVGKVVNDVVEKELDDAASALRTVNPELADSKDLFANVEKINRKITGAENKIKNGENGYVMYLDDNGREVYAQVDPAFASLYTYRYQIENAEASALAKMNAMMSRMFRYGTTSVNLSSFGNQLFRDFGNALLVGGSWSTIHKNADNLVDVFGERIVNEIKQFDPSGYEMRQVEQLAKESGQTINEAAVSRELMRGSAIAPSTTETTLYAKFMKEAYGKKSDTDLNNLKSSVESLLEKYNPDKLLNGKRENYLRRRVYASSYNDALKQGYNIEQARTYAEFAMNNATTNFSRQLYHLQAIADSTPYFRAAINGSKSFWRMWSLDPVGITGRITGGLIIPVMALTAFSLENKEDAEIYKNIPEYQKDSSIVFVFDGKPISIPVPQEISSIINPFRHFVEYLNQAQPNAFHELAMNDLLGFAPYDLTGFSTVDMDHMASEPTFFDRVSRGFARIFSSMAPVPLKTVYMLATGTDPYTGKSLRDPKNNVYFNEETGTTEVMDYNQNAFARLLAEWFGDSGMSSNLAEKVVSGVVGTTGSNLLGDITALFREGGDAFIKSAATNIGEQVMKPFDVPVYNLADATWKREIKNLTFEKEALLNSKKMVALNNELKFATDPEKRKKILAERSNLVNEFTQKVGNLVKGLSEEYGGTFDRQKFAAVMNLLNFDSDAGYQSGTQASSDIALSGYWDGRDAAIHTMQQLGINGPNDASIFGYLVKDDATGKTVMKYTSPIAIMDMKQQWYNQDEINYANINALIKSNGIKDAHDSITKQINAIYGSKSRLSNADRANIEAIQINWNTQLAKVLAPYISQMTPEAAINNSKVLNLLYPYVEVPGSWEKNNSNRSPSLGERGNKKKAYYDSWVKSMFSVNDRYKGQY